VGAVLSGQVLSHALTRKHEQKRKSFSIGSVSAHPLEEANNHGNKCLLLNFHQMESGSDLEHVLGLQVVLS
jgi:hypothetical protein